MTATDLTCRTTVADTVFVIGPGRSGTTLLYKLLCMHPEVAYISSLDNRFPSLPVEWTGRLRVRSYAAKLRYWFLKGGSAYLANSHRFPKPVPTPVEGEMLYRRYGLPADADVEQLSMTVHSSALPAVFSKLRESSQTAIFVSKRTANNRRLPTLDAIFPTARFVNLRRDGRDVAASLSKVAWWNDHPLWWDPQQRTPAQVSAQGEDMLRLCARNWVAETEAIQRGLAGIEPGRVLDVQFERLIAAPVEEMRRLLTFLGLTSSEDYERAVKTLNLDLRQGPTHRSWSADQLEMVNQEQGPELERLGYAI